MAKIFKGGPRTKIRQPKGGRPVGGPRGTQPGPRHPPGIQQGPRVTGVLQKKAMIAKRKIKKTKFETLTNQQNAGVSQYTTPAGGFMTTGEWKKVNQQTQQSMYNDRQEIRKNVGNLTGDYRVIVPPNSNLGRMPDGTPYNPNLAYEFDGHGNYRIVKDYGLGELS